MSSDIEKLLTQAWERYSVPETGVSAEFPEEPFLEEGEDDEDSDDFDDGSIALAAVCGRDKWVVHFDLVVSPAQMLITSSEKLAQQLRKELATDPDLELLGVEPRSCGELCGAVQRMHLRESGDFLTQWVIAAPECTIFAGVTSLDVQNEAVVERFLGSVEVESFEEEEG
jgi:hypothetical protein